MVASYVSLAVAGVALSAGTLASEFPVQERALEGVTTALFEAVESSDQEQVTNFFTEAYAAAVPLDAWQDDQLRLLLDQGPLRDLTAYRITWYPVDTLMGSVDFVGRDENGEDLVCGYVLWEFNQSEEPRLRWYQATHVDRSDLEAMSPEDAGARLLEANCAFTDLQANFALSKR